LLLQYDAMQQDFFLGHFLKYPQDMKSVTEGGIPRLNWLANRLFRAWQLVLWRSGPAI